MPWLEVVVHSVRHVKLFVFRPTVIPFGEPDFVLAQGFAVGGAGVLLVRCAVTDVAVHDDQRRAILGVLEMLERAPQHIEVVCVADSRHVPAIAEESCGHVFGKSKGSVAFDRDVVVVVYPAEIRKSQVSGERGGLARDALHHASVSAERVDIEVKEILEARNCLVVAGCQPFPRDGHTDAGGETLTERPRRGFHARCPAVLGMPRTAAVQLPERLDRIERH